MDADDISALFYPAGADAGGGPSLSRHGDRSISQQNNIKNMMLTVLFKPIYAKAADIAGASVSETEILNVVGL